MKSLFEPETYNETKERLDQLTPETESLWGRMTVDQMLWHCQGPFNIMLKKEDYGMKNNWLARLLFKKSLYNDKRWRKNLPTAKFLKTKDNKDFTEEKAELARLIYEAYSQRTKEEWDKHPAFGYFTKDQWGQLQYKHLDHHFRQFGV